MASDIPHPGVFVHNFLQVIDIILLIGQNKNTLKKCEVNHDARMLHRNYNAI